MTKENVAPVHPAQLQALEKKIFITQTAADTGKDIDKMFFEFMCSENAEGTRERQSAVMSYNLVKRLLTAVQRHQDPDDIYSLEITVNI